MADELVPIVKYANTFKDRPVYMPDYGPVERPPFSLETLGHYVPNMFNATPVMWVYNAASGNQERLEDGLNYVANAPARLINSVYSFFKGLF